VEREADRVAEAVLSGAAARVTPQAAGVQRMCAACDERGGAMVQAKSDSGAGATGEAAAQPLASGGEPLSAALRGFYEPRLGMDLAPVRVHMDAQAAESARRFNASAYTFGRHVVFGAGQFDPASRSGQRLLAHELAHVVQQRSAGPRLDRQPATAAPVAAFSVVRADYETMVSRTLQALSGRLLASTTFTSALLPILRSMFAQVVWRDSTGAEHGGGAYAYTVPGAGGTVLNLTMILDDMADPPEAGQFQSSGTDGRLVVRVRRSSGVPELTEVLYHEALHMMSWIINTHAGVGAVAGVERRAVRGLEMRRFTAQIAAIRRHLDSLAQSINARRRAAGRSEITAAELDRTAGWLMEEVQVRAETEVMQQALQVEQQRGRRAAVYITTQQYGDINRGRVDRYVFDFSRTFTPADRTGLTREDRATLQTLTEILEGFFQLHVRRRFSLTAYTISVPRERPRWEPAPLTPPSFLPRIGEAARRPPF
jgi:hypothetical protein